MQYPQMGNVHKYRVAVPELNGGVNFSVHPNRIEDNQLSDVTNMWYRNGSLKTRPAVDELSWVTRRAGMNYDFQSVGKYACIVGETATENYIATLDSVGNARAHYREKSGDNVSVMLASIHSDVSGTEDNDLILFMKGDNENDCGVFGLTIKDYHWNNRELTPYVPKVLINGRPQTSRDRTGVVGNQLEPYNMISDKYIATFTASNEGKYYFLPTANDEIVEIVYKAVSTEGDLEEATFTLNNCDENKKLYYSSNTGNYLGVGFAYNKENGCFHFFENLGTGQAQGGQNDPSVAVTRQETNDNNIIVTVKRNAGSHEDERNKILGCRFSAWFGGGASGLNGGNRLFVSGNPDHPNLVHWSSLNNPLYFPENNFAYVGGDDTAVTAFGKQSDMLVIFKETELFYTSYVVGGSVSASNVETQAVIDIESATVMFPMIQIHPEIGCDCPKTIQLCNNRLVWLNSDGNVYGLFSSGAYNERNIRRLSLQVSDRLRKISEDNLKKASATCFDEHYLLLIKGSPMYVMDYSSYGFNYYGSYSTDEKAQKAVAWYCWEFDVPINAVLRVRDTAMLLCCDERYKKVYSFLLNDDKSKDDVPQNAEGENTKPDEWFARVGVIKSRFATKLFDFGSSERFKRINSMYLQIGGEVGGKACVTYRTGKNTSESPDAAFTFTTPPEEAKPTLLRPSIVRVPMFGFEVSSECRIEVGDLIINYNAMGDMR